MSTASTRSRNRKKKRRSEAAMPKPKRAQPVAPVESQSHDLSERAWRICSFSIMAIATLLRLYNLALVPFHHDEGVNGNFLVRLVREGVYAYDPANYHGPSLYYFSAIIPWILRFLLGESAQNTYGLNTVTVRLIPALFGLATVWLALLLRRRLGNVGSLCAAALVAVSPGAVYLSRYFIHETLFVFFMLGVVVAGLKYYDHRHPIYLVLVSASAALLFATKETFIINAPVLLLAFGSTQICVWLRRRLSKRERRRLKMNRGDASLGEPFHERLREFGGSGKLAIWCLVAVMVFVGVSVLFYSSFFTNFPKGVYDSLKTFEIWTETGQKAHGHPRWKYIEWLGLQESPLLLLGAIGAAIALWRPKNSFALFASFWAFGTLAAYSLVPYKTPWLALNFIVPLALVAGYALCTVYEHGAKRGRQVVTVVLVLAITVNGYQAIDLNFYNYDNDAKTINLNFLKHDLKPQYYVYVYAHTHRETLKLVDEINRIAKSSGEGGRMGITIVSSDYWPLPWYLRDYSRVGYHGRLTASKEPVIIASESQGTETQAMFGTSHEHAPSGLNPAGGYRLRPGVSLQLYVRRDVLWRTR